MYFARHPGLFDHPEAAIRLIYEEVCLRQVEGEEVHLSELVRRFPQWRTELEVLLDVDRLLGSGPEPPDFPVAGETLGDFLLLACLDARQHLGLRPSLRRQDE